MLVLYLPIFQFFDIFRYHFDSIHLQFHIHFAVKLIGKTQDGTVFVRKGHGDDEDDLFEFKTDEGILPS